jgi:hypothetical protein
VLERRDLLVALEEGLVELHGTRHTAHGVCVGPETVGGAERDKETKTKTGVGERPSTPTGGGEIDRTSANGRKKMIRRECDGSGSIGTRRH